MKTIRFMSKLLFFVLIFSLINCKDKFKECCKKEEMVLNFHEKKFENEQEIDWIQCKGEKNQQTEFKIINGKISRKVIKLNDSLFLSFVYDKHGKEFLVDTLLIKDKLAFQVGWSLEKNKTNLGERKVLREYFRIKNSSFMNQEKVYYNDKIDMDSSYFFSFEDYDSKNYRLNIYMPIYIPEKVLDNIYVVLKLSDEIKNDFSNIDKINEFEEFHPYADSGVYWILPKREMKGYIELLSEIDSAKSEFFHSKIYINKN